MNSNGTSNLDYQTHLGFKIKLTAGLTGFYAMLPYRDGGTRDMSYIQEDGTLTSFSRKFVGTIEDIMSAIELYTLKNTQDFIV